MNTFLGRHGWMMIAVMTVLVAPVWSMTVQAAPSTGGTADPVPSDIRALIDAANELITDAKTLATQASDIAQSAKADVQVADLSNPLPANIAQKKDEAVAKIGEANKKIAAASKKIQEAKDLLTSQQFGTGGP